MAATGTVSLEDWKKSAKSQQEVFLQLLGDRIWDEFEYPGNKAELFIKIGTALYGKALAQADDLGFPEEKKKVINNLLDKCVKHSLTKRKVRLAFIYIAVYVNGTVQNWVPLIRVMSKELPDLKQYYDCFIQQNVYIDHLGRVYENFTSYLGNNTWDLCYICFPASGYYGSGQTFIVHSQIDVKREILDGADKISTITNVVTTCAMIGGVLMSLFPPTAPIGVATVTYSAVAAAPGVVYGVGRSVGKLVDRKVHEQSVSLMDPEARQHWLMTATALASAGALASSAVITRLAKSGVAASSTARGVCTGFKIATVTLSGGSIVNQSVELYKGKKLTTFEIFQLTTQIFFFTHSLIEFKTAQTIYEEAQQAEISAMKNNILPENQEKFDNVLNKLEKKSGSSGRAEFIRKIKKIDNSNYNQFFDNFKITKKGNVCINKKFSITPQKFVKLTDSEMKSLLDSSKKGKISPAVRNLVKEKRLFVRKGFSGKETPGNVSSSTLPGSSGTVFNSTFLKGKEKIDKSLEKKESFLNLSVESQGAVRKLIRHYFELLEEKKRNEQCPPEELEKFLSGGDFNEYCDSLIDLFLSCTMNNVSLPLLCLTIIMDIVSRDDNITGEDNNISGKDNRREAIHSIVWTQERLEDFKKVKSTFLWGTALFSIYFIIDDDFFTTTVYSHGELIEGPFITFLQQD